VQLHLDSSGRERFCRILFKKEFFWGAEKREYSRVLLPYSERKNKVSRRLLACTGSVLVRRTGLSGWTHTHAHGVCGSGFDRYTSVLHSCMYVVRHSVLFVLLTTGSLASRSDGGGIDLWLILGFKWNHLHKAVCMRCIQRWGVQNKIYPFTPTPRALQFFNPHITITSCMFLFVCALSPGACTR
jgi:hypothetical protein